MMAGALPIAVQSLALEAIGGAVPELANASRVWTRRRGVLVRMMSGGLVGLGEASPLPGYSPDTLEQALAELRELRLPAELTPGSVPLRSPSARFAIDSALLDLAGKRAGVPAARLLSPASRGRVLPLAALIPIAGAWNGGDADAVKVVKVKIGRDLPSELERIAELRDRGLAVRVDANRSLDAASAPRILAALAELGVSLIEEPVIPEVLSDLRLPIPVALDETLGEPGWRQRAQQLAGKGALAALVFKPARLGGLAALRHAASAADELGTQLIVSHLLDGPVALASCWQLALALATDGAQGLAPHPALAALTPPGIALPRSPPGAIAVGADSGLGLACRGGEAACP